jgi:polysaccharide export outer membrane protein
MAKEPACPTAAAASVRGATVMPGAAMAAVLLAAAMTFATSAPGEYLIGPKDILKVTVYGHEDLTQQVLVQSDGSFIFPLIGRVSGGDMTVKELERKLGELLARGYIRDPQVTVEVQEYRSKIVYVVGEVQKPGTYPLEGATGLVAILAKAGPMTQNAAAEVLVVRPPAGSEIAGPLLPNLEGSPDASAGGGAEAAPSAPAGALVIRVNIRDLQAGALAKNVLLRPNDTIFVPQAPKIFVSGEVRNPGAYAFFPDITARQLISLAGGLTQYGSDGRLRIVRTAGGKSEEGKIRLDDPIGPGDTLVVRRKLF